MSFYLFSHLPEPSQPGVGHLSSCEWDCKPLSFRGQPGRLIKVKKENLKLINILISKSLKVNWIETWLWVKLNDKIFFVYPFFKAFSGDFPPNHVIIFFVASYGWVWSQPPLLPPFIFTHFSHYQTFNIEKQRSP